MTLHKTALAGLVVLISLAGCARSEMQALANKCDFSADPRFADLRGKVPLSSAEATAPPSLSEISNENRPTPTERDSLIEFQRYVAILPHRCDEHR
jgi:hypothetical protein